MPGDRAVVLDASVAIRWLIPEVGSDEAIALFTRGISWTAPRLIVTEFCATLRRKVLARDLRVEDAVLATNAFKAAIVDNLIDLSKDEELVPEALVLALSLGHKLPDCMYLALAERNGAAIATADKALARIASARDIAVHFVSSA